MIIIGVDVGKQGGIAIKKKNGCTTKMYKFFSKEDTYIELRKIFDKLHPTTEQVVVVICQSFGRGNAKYQHARFYGIVELVAEQYNAYLVFKSDRSLRAEYFGKDKGKQQTHDHFKCPTMDESDAKLACYWGSKFIKHDTKN